MFLSYSVVLRTVRKLKRKPKIMMKKTIAIAVITTVFLGLTGCNDEDVSVEEIAVVKVMEVTPMPITQEVYAVSRLEGEEDAIIVPAVGGRIEEVLVHEGDSVTAGEALVRLATDQQISAGTTAAVAGINAARANAENAERTYTRLTSLYEAGAISEQQLDGASALSQAAGAQLVQAQALYNQASSIADNSYINAPFSGTIGRIWAREGNMAGSGMPLLSIANGSSILARALLPERYINSLHADLPARAALTTDDQTNFPGTVIAAAKSVDPISGMVAVEARFPNTEQTLMPGMSARIAIGIQTTEDALSVPEIALRHTSSGNELALCKDGIAEVVQVNTGITSMGMVEITEGLNPGDLVIIQGQQSVTNGQSVEIWEASE